jgi:hypothetical protein
MDVFWLIVTETFVVAVLALVLWATYRAFGGHHTPQH